LKGTIIISDNVFIGANAYLRGPIFLSNSVKVGPSSEIKQSLIFDNSAIAHFNYIGNSIVGQNINFEASSICANYFNERQDKNIFIKYNNQIIDTKTEKFGSLVGDNSKIGANAVLSPGSILEKNSIVKRLELIEQIKQ
jgi:bifunctional N-acetylglucosamine-1-phosphate-uridyltransferase/glucosamine-1-phosphate-acetyltransferase GlmU-like protein